MRKIEKVELEEKEDLLISASALCMLDLLYTRLFDEHIPEILKDDNLDINYDFSLFGEEVIEEKDSKGYTNEKFSESADNYIRRL